MVAPSTEYDLERALADLNSTSFRRQHTALKALMEMRTPESVPTLIELISATGVQDALIRSFAVRVVGEIGDVRAGSALTELLSKRLGSTSDLGIAIVTIKALGKIRSKESVSLLLEALRASAPRQQLGEFYETPEKFAPGGEVVFLAQWLVDFHDDVQDLRTEAARALGKIGDARAVQGLIEAIWEEEIEYGDTAPREEAAWALEQIGTPEALAAVEKWRREQEKENQD